MRASWRLDARDRNRRRHYALMNTILSVMGVPAPLGFGDAKPTDLIDLSLAV